MNERIARRALIIIAFSGLAVGAVAYESGTLPASPWPGRDLPLRALGGLPPDRTNDVGT
jgi:hypothetical protein